MNRKERRANREPQPGRLPVAGQRDDSDVACVVCLQACDSGLILRGEPQWMVAFHVTQLEIPEEEAAAMLKGIRPGQPAIVRLCQSCAAKASLQVGSLAAGVGIPAYVQAKDEA